MNLSKINHPNLFVKNLLTLFTYREKLITINIFPTFCLFDYSNLSPHIINLAFPIFIGGF